MQGLYIDSTHNLKILLPIDDHRTEVVDSSEKYETKNPHVIEKSKHIITWKTGSLCINGYYNGDNCFKWENGDVWYLINMSPTQQYILTRKPYIPLTFLLVNFIYSSINTCWHSVYIFLKHEKKSV